jgi:RES domain
LIVYRCFPRRQRADEHREGGALWFPRAYQGKGRHDNPDLYGCLYVGEEEIAPVAEQLQVFRGGRRLATWMLEREGVPLALAAIELPDDSVVLDLDDPRVLVREELRPSGLATHERVRTQAAARMLFERHFEAAALRWWSTLEASWLNLTVFERAGERLRVVEQRELTVFDAAVREAAEFLGLG